MPYIDLFSSGYNFGDNGLAWNRALGGFIDINKNLKIKTPEDVINVVPFKDGITILIKGTEGLTFYPSEIAIMNDKGEMLTGFDFKYCYETSLGFNDGLLIVKDNSTDLYGAIDKTGKIVVPMKYNHIYAYNEGVAIATLGQTRSIINTSGKELGKIENLQNCYISFVGEFVNGLAYVKYARKDSGFSYIDTYIDKTGTIKLIIESGWSGEMISFSDGLAPIEYPGTDKIVFIDTEGNVVTETQATSAYTTLEGTQGFKNGYIVLGSTGTIKDLKLVDKNGNAKSLLFKDMWIKSRID